MVVADENQMTLNFTQTRVSSLSISLNLATISRAR
jgi:hypothetical protein